MKPLPYTQKNSWQACCCKSKKDDCLIANTEATQQFLKMQITPYIIWSLAFWNHMSFQLLRGAYNVLCLWARWLQISFTNKKIQYTYMQ